MKSVRVGLALAGILLVIPLAVQADDGHTAVSNNGAGLETGARGFGVRVSKSFAGRAEAIGFGAVLQERLSMDDVAVLRALEPVSAPVGVESIIGPDQRKRVRKTKKFPHRAVALVRFAGRRCTGWMINKNTVATAGHCVHEGGPGGSWYPRSSFKIYPGYTGSKAPYGSCKAKRLYTVAGWIDFSSDEYDYGAIKLKCDIGKKTGWFGYFWQAASLTGTKTIITGYPGDRPLTMWKSKGRVTVTQTRRVFYKNDTVSGMSGSPVYHKKGGCGWCSMAVHAYGTYNGPPFINNNHGTRITQAVFNNFNNWKNAK